MSTTPDLDEWVAARGPSLLRLAYVLTGTATDAEALVEEALSRVLPAWSRISRLDDCDARVRRLVVSAHQSTWRRWRRVDVPRASLRDDPPVAGIVVEVRDDLWHACQDLPLDQRTAVVLRFYEDLDLAEIAALTGVREEVAHTRVARGVATLGNQVVGPAVDFDEQLRDTLDRGSEAAPAPTDLAHGARARLRRRRARRARIATAAAAVVAVAAAVPAVLAGAGAIEARQPDYLPIVPVPTTAVDPVDVTPVDYARRTVTWRGLTFVVPGEWKRGASTTWCTRGRRPGGVAPTIAFPDDASARIACTPRSGYGVTVAPAGATDLDPARESGEVWQYATPDVAAAALYPDGAWVAVWFDEDWVITIVTTHQPLTDRIVGSINSDQVDVNGCAVTYDQFLERTAVGPRGVGASLCQYEAAGPLHDSERLTVQETAAALSAIEDAPGLSGGDGCDQQQGWRITLTPAGGAAYLGRYGTGGLGACQDGVVSTVPGQSPEGSFELTADVVTTLRLDDLPVG